MGWIANLFKSKEEKNLKGKGFKDAYADRERPIEKLNKIIEKHDRDKPVKTFDLSDTLDEYLVLTKEAVAIGDQQLANIIAKKMTEFKKKVNKQKAKEMEMYGGKHRVSLARAEQIFHIVFKDFTPDDVRKAMKNEYRGGLPPEGDHEIVTKTGDSFHFISSRPEPPPAPPRKRGRYPGP